MGKHHPTSNDNRSRSMNPQDSAGKAAASNHARQVTENEAADSSE